MGTGQASAGGPPAYSAHPTAVIDQPCQIGAGTRIWHFSHIMRDCRIGARCNIGQNVVVSPGCVIGDNVKIQNNVSVYTGVTIEDDVFLGPSMVFTNVINPRAFIERKAEFRATRVGRGATVGANATIVCGVRLGEYCLVGAGAVVTHDVVPFATVYGNPAHLRGWVCWCGEQLPITPQAAGSEPEWFACQACARRYRRGASGLVALEA
jgi:UDP-2-acetamido-3-amino-2,3-dideoxy-glucuronate N-acetyltransferase